MSTRLTAVEHREKILDAAGLVFARGGFAGTSTDAVALEAGVAQLLNALPAMDAPAHTAEDPALAALAACALGHGCDTHLSREAGGQADRIPSPPRTP